VRSVEIETLLAAYALDAVEPHEAETVEGHLRECPRCRSQVAEHREVASLLAYGGSQSPAGVWERIIADLEERPPRLDVAFHRGPRRVEWAAAAAVAVVAAATVGLLGADVGHLDHVVSALQHDLTGSGEQRAALAALLDPRARQIELRSDRTADAVQVVVLPDGDGFVVQAALPALAAGETYQLWGLAEGRTMVPLGVLGREPATVAFRLRPPDVSELVITAEPSPGVATTHRPAVVAGRIPALT
jgi:anti-sigma factor RsiW